MAGNSPAFSQRSKWPKPSVPPAARFFVSQMKRFFFAFLLVGTVTSRANPVALPSVVMSGENVLISVTPEVILVAGRYRFRATEERVPKNDPRYLPFNAYFDLPVPVPENTNVNANLGIELVPELSFQDRIVKGHFWGVYDAMTSVPGVKFAAVSFGVEGISSLEFEVTIRYQQPVIHSGGRMFAYYIPLLPNYEHNKGQYGLKDEAYVVSFEALLGSTLNLLTPRAKVLQSSPKVVSIQALHREVLEVEIIPPPR